MINEATVNAYCFEDISKIENYDKAIADKSQTWQCHHKAEILPCGNYSVKQLKQNNLYYHQPAERLIFMTVAEHNALHNSLGGRAKKMGLKNKGHKRWLGRKHSTKSKQKMSDSHKGKPAWNKGKTNCYSEETLQKMRIAALNRKISDETRKKLSLATSAANKKQDISARFKGRVYWNNGMQNCRAFECPGPEWKRGKLKKAH